MQGTQFNKEQFEEISQWRAHKEKTQNLRNVCLIENRIKLLQNENSKRQKRIQESIIKTTHLNKIHEAQDLFGKIKAKHKYQQDIDLRQLRQKTETMKLKLEQERSFNHLQVKQMKQQEYGELRIISQKNDEIINTEREQLKQTNQQKCSSIRQQEELSYQKINDFKLNNKQQYTQEHNNTKHKNLTESAAHLQKLQRLEEFEMQLIQSLQASYLTSDANKSPRAIKRIGGLKYFGPMGSQSQNRFLSFDLQTYSGMRLRTEPSVMQQKEN